MFKGKNKAYALKLNNYCYLTCNYGNVNIIDVMWEEGYRITLTLRKQLKETIDMTVSELIQKCFQTLYLKQNIPSDTNDN